MLFSRSIEVDGPVEMKLITRQYKNLSEAFVVAEDIMFFRFPSFIYGKELDGKEIPSFCFHSITPDVFEPILQYLRDNDYCTLSIREYLEFLSGRKKLVHPRSVLLTFDDGTGSIWTTVYPLLKNMVSMQRCLLSRDASSLVTGIYPTLKMSGQARRRWNAS